MPDKAGDHRNSRLLRAYCRPPMSAQVGTDKEEMDDGLFGIWRNNKAVASVGDDVATVRNGRAG